MNAPGRARRLLDADDGAPGGRWPATGEVAQRFGKDPQVAAIRGARRYFGDRMIRVAARTSCSIRRRAR